MIPTKLSLKNFMCFRDNVPPLSFEGIHVACLWGNNGNGKSAIFDAMTWALWGQSRAKSDDDLIHQGQAEMEVELEFAVSDRRYRVLRKHAMKPSQSRAGQTILELQVADNRNFRTISGNTKSETQQKIIDLLRLDYDTFKNSAFLRQGHSDEFSIKRPGERKEILANILDLSRYDELERESKSLATDRRTEADRLETSIQEINVQLQQKAECKLSTESLQREILHIKTLRLSMESTLSNLRQQKQSLEIKKGQLSYARLNLEETKRQMEFWKGKTSKQETRISEYRSILAKEADVQKGYSEFLEISDMNERLNQKLSQLLALKEKMNTLQGAIRDSAEKVGRQHSIAQARVVEMESKWSRAIHLEDAVLVARNSLTKLATLSETLPQKRRESQQIASQISRLESNSLHLETQIADVKEKLRLVKEGDIHCPLCETELGSDGLQRIENKLSAEASDREQRHRDTAKELDRLRLQLRALEKELADSESLLDKERAVRLSRLNAAENELTEARKAGDELALEKPKLTALELQLSGKDYAKPEQARLDELVKEEEKLQYDRMSHEQVRRKLSSLRQFEKLRQELDEAGRSIDQATAALAESRENIVRLTGEFEVNSRRSSDLTAETAALPEVSGKLVEAEKDNQRMLEEERLLRDSLAAAQERLRQFSELEEARTQKEKLHAAVLQEESIYRELAEAFGKKGLQALLIEQALPEIEIEANRLLGKMTDNRMSLALESQRETRKGDTMETLDIKIADELGTRSYEMYSGGEAFRIDLALRIALSKLLVRRAGAALPMLIIDEGFGSQDNAAREKLVEAINSIQDDFEKIIVITHLEDLRDRFPVLINVTKTPVGSVISLS